MKIVNLLYRQIRKTFSKRYPRLYSFCDDRKSQIKFFFAGSSAALVNLLFLIILHGWLAWSLVLSTSLAFIISFAVSFNLQKFWAFRNYHYKKIPQQLGLYLLNAIVGLSLNGFLMHLLVNIWGLWYLLAQIAVSLTIGLYNFLVYNFIIFRRR